MSVTLAAASKLKRFWDEPCFFVRDQFGAEPDLWQAEALEAFAKKDQARLRLALVACAGPGKSCVLAWLAWWFLLCCAEKGDHPNGYAISESNANLRDALWKELSHWQQKSPLLTETFQWTQTRIFHKAHPSTWWLSARSWSKDASPEQQGRALSGLHAKYVLILMDESGSMPEILMKRAEQALSAINVKWGRVVQAGNPTSTSGVLYFASVRDRKNWHVIRITGDPDDPRRSPRIDVSWAKNQIELYGRENPWVMSYILGLFPPSALNTLLGVEEVEAAMRRVYRPEQFEFSQKRLGIDVARFGGDRTVIFPRQGLVAFRPVVMRNARSFDIAARVMVAKQKFQSEMEFIDDTGGWGAGVIDCLIQAQQSPMGINFGGKAGDPRYYNKRSEIHWELAKWVKSGGALPNMPEIVNELTAPVYYMDKGRLRLEEKEQIKKRLQFSPDLSDALALSFSIPDMPKEITVHTAKHIRQVNDKTKMLHEFDPYSPTEVYDDRPMMGVDL